MAMRKGAAKVAMHAINTALRSRIDVTSCRPCEQQPEGRAVRVTTIPLLLSFPVRAIADLRTHDRSQRRLRRVLSREACDGEPAAAAAPPAAKLEEVDAANDIGQGRCSRGVCSLLHGDRHRHQASNPEKL
jgi:hypothetical protein